MQIESSSLALQSQNSAYSLYTKREQLQVTTGNSGSTQGQQAGLTIIHTQITQQDFLASFKDFTQNNKGVSLQDEAKKLAQQLSNTNNNSPNSNAISSATATKTSATDSLASMSPSDKLKMLIIFLLLSRMQGDPKLMKALGLDAGSVQTSAAATTPSTTATANAAATASTQSAAASIPVVEYQAQQMLYQSQTAQFSAQGQIKTADGKTININVNLQMSSQSMELSDIKERMQAATKDPLVINLDGSAATLSNQRFSFDLMGDGNKVSIPELTGNRAFLVLDKNNDGVVNDGTELFGPQTQDGFKELAQYDQDKNGWIDERDPVFNSLKLWIDAGTSSERLVSLKDAGIGALYVGSAKTTFNINGSQGSQDNLGTIQSTGIFLNEDGSVGTIQHVDLSV